MLNPEKLPVSVYRWDDANAPKLDNYAGCVSTILKACLVTGYGSKAGAGWSLPFEDLQTGIKVLRPSVSAEQDFYLRLSADSGKQLTAQVYISMTDVNAGNLKLQCDAPFKYGYGKKSGKWVVIATARGVWFLFEQIYSPEDMNKSGGYFVCGDTVKNEKGNKAVFLQHTGGSWSDGAFWDILNKQTDGRGWIEGKLLSTKDLSVVSFAAESFFDAKTTKTTEIMLSPLYIFANAVCYQIPAIYASSTGAIKNNFDEFDNKMVFGLSSYQTSGNLLTNFYFDTDGWVY